MRKYKIIFIVCFVIVLIALLYTFIPQINLAKKAYDEDKNGTKNLSQNDLRATSVGEAYIPDDVREYNENVVHSEEESDDNHSGDGGAGEKYATPIYGGKAVAKHFRNSSSYYVAELKLEEALYNYIPTLLKDTTNMTNSALKEYFANNMDVIEQKLGIVSDEVFVQFIGSMDKLNGKKYIRIDIPERAITENYTNLGINFLIELTLEDGSKVAPISGTILHTKSTVNQKAPYVQFVGLYKSQRAE